MIHRRQRQITRAYRESGALDPAPARRPDDPGVACRPVLHRLVRRGVLVDHDGGRYDLDTSAAERFARRRRARALPGVLRVLGGCCGTDDRHIRRLAESSVARRPR